MSTTITRITTALNKFTSSALNVSKLSMELQERTFCFFKLPNSFGCVKLASSPVFYGGPLEVNGGTISTAKIFEQHSKHTAFYLLVADFARWRESVSTRIFGSNI